MKGSLQVNELQWLWHDGKDGLLKIVHSPEMNEIVYVFSFSFAYFKPRAIYDSFPQCVFSDEEQSRFPSLCIVCHIYRYRRIIWKRFRFPTLKHLGILNSRPFERYVDCAW